MFTCLFKRLAQTCLKQASNSRDEPEKWQLEDRRRTVKTFREETGFRFVFDVCFVFIVFVHFSTSFVITLLPAQSCHHLSPVALSSGVSHLISLSPFIPSVPSPVDHCAQLHELFKLSASFIWWFWLPPNYFVWINKLFSLYLRSKACLHYFVHLSY